MRLLIPGAALCLIAAIAYRVQDAKTQAAAVQPSAPPAPGLRIAGSPALSPFRPAADPREEALLAAQTPIKEQPSYAELMADEELLYDQFHYVGIDRRAFTPEEWHELGYTLSRIHILRMTRRNARTIQERYGQLRPPADLAKRLGIELSEHELESARALAETYVIPLENALANAPEYLADCMADYFDSGNYQTWPAGEDPLPSPFEGSTGTYRTLAMTPSPNGLVYRLAFDSIHYPALESQLLEIRRLGKEGNQAITDYLLSLER